MRSIRGKYSNTQHRHRYPGTSYNYPSRIKDGSKTYDYFYDGNRQRWKQTYSNGVDSEETIFIAGVLEKRTEGTFSQYRHYINIGSQQVALYTRDTGGGVSTEYFLLDHMGSFAAITNSTGGDVVDESFTAFGDRRDAGDWVGPPSAGDQAIIDDTTQRGFTFHTNAEASSFVHMNGRVADSLTGRFLSADPHVPDPGATQSFNRYSYVYNNPLSYTDPSGFTPCLFEFAACIDVIGSVFAFAKDLIGNKDTHNLNRFEAIWR